VKTIPLKKNDKIIDWEMIETNENKANNELIRYEELSKVAEFVKRYIGKIQNEEDIENPE
jgi:hypothetical protein